MDYYEEEDEFINAWDTMLSEYHVCENTWLRNMFELRRKWAKAYLNCEWMLHDKRYKELQAEYALCHKMPKIKMDLKILMHAGNVYTNAIFEEFQNQYVKAMEADIKGCREEGGIFIYTIVDHQSRDRQVKRSLDDFLSCSCGMFEMMGVLCSHVIKILREVMHVKEIPRAYILKRWTRDVKVRFVQDNHGRNIKADVKLEVTSRYKNLCHLFTKISSMAAENDESYTAALHHIDELSKVIDNIWKLKIYGENENGYPDYFSIACDTNENEHVLDVPKDIHAKGLKRRESSKGRRRLKSFLEKP
ncbi:protein FAR1-RELATED SEQUENCE 1-like [Cornus florida]|uniref:protein FAR1-RELATED SEQUENCE 1-like n=1 Tax=Cornus florida TaxID=4283 RepID=UPI00289E003C|nr:protein FAR1-RELATED SEQUENCE 1-like [Cornus florida]